MNVKGWIFLGAGTLCMAITAVYLHLLLEDYSQKRSRWNILAKETFVEALRLETTKRGNIPTQVISVKSPKTQTLEEPIPDSVTLKTEYGERTYKISREKFEHSLVKESRKRLILSILLEDYPIDVDTLNQLWDSLLSEKRIPANTCIRYSVTDSQGRTAVAHSKQNAGPISSDSLLSSYMGFRCEAEATGFVSYKNWTEFNWHQWVVLLLPWVVFCIFLFTYDNLWSYLRCRFKKQKIVFEEKEVVVEKQVRIMDEDAEKVNLYKLEDGVLFDSEERTIIKDGITVINVAPQTAILLKAFLNAKGHRLTEEDIYREIWNGKTDSNKLHMALLRLRKCLKNASSLEVQYESEGAYRLKKAHSIEKMRS